MVHLSCRLRRVDPCCGPRSRKEGHKDRPRRVAGDRCGRDRQRLVEHAAELAIDLDLRSLDALHLAAALVLPREELLIATWDRRLHAAAHTTGLPLIPETVP
jgi:predicted nucleic acid-binding protein